LRKCQRKASERAVHDLRVEARRLLSLLDLMSPFLAAPGRLSRTQAALKCHLDRFDDLRDTHVQLAAVSKLRRRFPAARLFYRALKKCEARLCRWTRKHAKRLHDKPLAKLIAACREDVQLRPDSGARGATRVLVRTLSLAFAATTKLRNRIHQDDPHSIHRTRIAFKKFRYMVETLASQLAWVDKNLLENMHQYQSLMGNIQDAQVLLHAFEKFSRKEKIEPRPAAQFTHELLRRRQKFISTYLAAADRLFEFWPPAPLSPSPQPQHTQLRNIRSQDSPGKRPSDSAAPRPKHELE
jgi:CHAD domain-containing protein